MDDGTISVSNADKYSTNDKIKLHLNNRALELNIKQQGQLQLVSNTDTKTRRL
jgi:hypothetical protein